MLSSVFSALLASIMILIVASLIVAAMREHRRHMREIPKRAQASTLPLSLQMTLPLQDQFVENGAVDPIFTLPSSWYTRRRIIVSLGLLLMLLLALFVQEGLADGALQLQNFGKSIAFFSYTQPADVRPVAHSVPLTASQLLVRVDSSDRNQYYSDYQWRVWSYSSCSGIALEVVMNAYGRHLLAADVLQEELKLGVWSVQLGLLRDEGIPLAASYFGFNANISHTRTLQGIIALSNKGFPIIVSVRDYYYFPGGHIFVVTGGDNQYVYIADSSPANFRRMTYAMFLNMWQGQSFSALLTPR